MKAKRKTKNYKKYLNKVNIKNPYHILGIILLIGIMGIAAMWIIKALIYFIVIIGLFYVSYLLIQKRRKR